MIAKKDWFTIRKFGGWGLTPATKEGWMYIGVFVGLVTSVQFLPISLEARNWIAYAMIALLLIDIGTVMLFLNKDERERAHEAIAERNASWAMVTALVIGMLYKTIVFGKVDPIFLAIILVGAMVKSLTFIYLRNK